MRSRPHPGAGRPSRSRASPHRRLAPAGPTHRARERCRLRLHLSACLERLAARRRRDRALLAACRRAAAARLRCLLAAGRLSGAACRERSPTPTRFKQGLTRFAATRPVHGECGGYMVLGAGLVDAGGVRHAMTGLALPRDELRRAPPASRLSDGEAASGLPAWASGHEPARS